MRKEKERERDIYIYSEGLLVSIRKASARRTRFDSLAIIQTFCDKNRDKDEKRLCDLGLPSVTWVKSIRTWFDETREGGD